jgi:uncharacterized protein YceH (UPF0502 family)
MRIPRPLDATEVRILGALLEKEQTTPDHYPLTVNALLAACNQKSNRDPVTQLSEGEIWDALDELRKEVLVWRTEGARAERWSQSISRRLELDRRSKALMTVLLLRGPQTPGELRARTERMHAFADRDEVEATLQAMAEGAEPLVQELPRAPGQKECRWLHLLSGEPDLDAYEAAAEAAPAPTSGGPTLTERVQKLEDEVSELRRELAALRGD